MARPRAPCASTPWPPCAWSDARAPFRGGTLGRGLEKDRRLRALAPLSGVARQICTDRGPPLQGAPRFPGYFKYYSKQLVLERIARNGWFSATVRPSRKAAA